MTLALDMASEGAAAPFVSVEIFFDVEAAHADLAALAAHGGAYQSPAFLDAWSHAFGARLVLAVARDGAGRPAAALGLHVRRWGPLSVARFAGDGWANYHFGLFRDPADWRAQDVRALLRAAGRTAGVDLFAFRSSPAEGGGLDNPLWALAGVASPSPALASRLPASYAEWLDAHFSPSTQKKLRKKLKKLEIFGPVAHRRARDAGEALGFLDALYGHKAQLAKAGDEPDLFADPRVRALLRRLTEGAMEMHALLAGERVVAVLGALPSGGRLSGLVISYDGAGEIAAATPGVQLVALVVRDAIARGFEKFDLGVGDARYKRETCEIEERLRDLAYGVTPLGRLAAPLYLGLRAALGAVKRRPALYARALAMRRALTPRR